jgi:hypothetical protein
MSQEGSLVSVKWRCLNSTSDVEYRAARTEIARCRSGATSYLVLRRKIAAKAEKSEAICASTELDFHEQRHVGAYDAHRTHWRHKALRNWSISYAESGIRTNGHPSYVSASLPAGWGNANMVRKTDELPASIPIWTR